jgi:hypothetical protein
MSQIVGNASQRLVRSASGCVPRGTGGVSCQLSVRNFLPRPRQVGEVFTWVEQRTRAVRYQFAIRGSDTHHRVSFDVPRGTSGISFGAVGQLDSSSSSLTTQRASPRVPRGTLRGLQGNWSRHLYITASHVETAFCSTATATARQSLKLPRVGLDFPLAPQFLASLASRAPLRYQIQSYFSLLCFVRHR